MRQSLPEAAGDFAGLRHERVCRTIDHRGKVPFRRLCQSKKLLILINKIMPKNNNAKILLDLKVYPLEAIYGAAYVFVDRAYIFLDQPTKDTVEVSLKPKGDVKAKTADSIKGEFLNELLNYTLRLSLAKYNKKIREYIIERALYASVQSDEPAFDAEFDDPLGIAVPWEEKYGETAKKKNTAVKKKKAAKKPDKKPAKKSKK